MSGWNNWGIRRKLFSIVLLILILNVVVLVFMGSTLFEKFYQASKIKELRSSADTIQDLYVKNSETIYDEISSMENENVIVTIFSFDADGGLELKYHSRSQKWDTHPWGDKPDMPKPREEDVQRFENQMKDRLAKLEEHFNQTAEMEPSLNIPKDGSITLSMKLDENLYLYIETPRGYIKSTADLAVKYTAYLSIAILLAGAVVIYFVVARITRPIQSIQRVANKISRLDFTEKCETQGGDEIASLAASINGMSGELQASIEKLVGANEVLQNDLIRQQQTDHMRQQFVANVSHDFKTPLTLMISYAEALMEQASLPETEKEYCGIIISEGNKLAEMVGRLLNLSKLESGVDKPAYSIFCLSELFDEVIHNHKIISEKREMHVIRQWDEEFIVNADYQKIGLVVTNLFENAVKYAPEGGTIRINAYRNHQNCRVEISNTGNRIAEDDLENLFESFYRADKSRTAGGSFGLGLAIVKVVMETHGMPFGVENTEDGVRFWFELEAPDMGDEEEAEED